MLDLDRIPWTPTRHAGVHVHFLSADRESGYAAVLIRMEPGCAYPPHRHRGSEELLVLSGAYEDELGCYAEGSFVRYDDGSRHHPRCPEDAASDCVLFAIAREGIELLET